VALTDSPFAAASHGAFAEPWAIAVHPQNGALFITEKAGTMKFYEPASGRMGNVTGLPEVAYGGQGGLGDIAFAPDFAQSGTVYLSWAADAGDGARKAVLGRGRLACADGGDCRIEGLAQIWEQSLPVDSAGHFSHKVAFSPDGGHLFVSSGDRMQADPAQDLGNNLGSVVRLQLDGTPAPGNPFADRGAPTDQVWTYGQRNVLGLQFDPDGELWGLEHGPRGGDELNLVERGVNYGWPVVSDGVNYNGSAIPDHETRPEFTPPVIGWTPVIAPGDFIFYSGRLWPQWQGKALIAGLGPMTLVEVSVSGNDASEDARYRFPKRLRDIVEAPDGTVWMVEDGNGGRLLRLAPTS
jgi:glucose/arabinose dehydrogenase